MVGEKLEDIIKETVNRRLQDKSDLELKEIIETDNLGEVIEKLIIVHIRTWMLEDAVAQTKSDKEVADLKRKIDICFKVKRPKYVQAINKMIDNAIIQNKSLVEDSVKFYKGIDND